MFLRFLPFVVFDGDDVPSTTSETPPAAVEPAPQPAPQPGPWDADLAVFQDPELRQQVDGFMREKVQPRMTQLETQLAGYKPAIELYNDLSGENSEDALKQVIAELYDPEVAEKFTSLLEPAADAQPEPQIATPEPAPLPPEVQEIIPEVQEIIAERQAQKEQEDYDRELSRVKGQHPSLVEDLFHPFVAGAEGNFDAALEAYKAFEARAAQTFGGEQPAAEPPPTTLTEASSPAPPVAPKYASIDDAMDAMFAEAKAAPPAPVGVV